MKKWTLYVVAILFSLILAACGSDKDTKDEPATETDGTAQEDTGGSAGTEETNPPPGDAATEGKGEGTFVTVDLMDEDENAIGTAELTQEQDGVHVKVNAEGLDEGEYALNFHEYGKCDAPDFATAGENFNPTTAEQGSQAGNLPSLTVDKEGKGEAEFTADNVTLKAGEDNSLFQEGGTSLVIEEKTDGGSTEGSKESGNRIACGVVKQ